MRQECESQTIYFKDLLFRALYQWKTALVVALIFALAMGGVGLLKSNEPVNLNTVTLTPEMQQKVDRLRTDIEVSQRNLECQREYIADSILLQINPYAVYTAGFHAVIYPQSMMTSAAEASAVDSTGALIRAYQVAMNDSKNMEEMAKSLNIQSQYLAELIYVDVSVNGILGFSIRGRDLQEAKKISDWIQSALVAKTEQIGDMVEPHTVKIIPFESGPKIDTALYDMQNSANQKMTTLTNNLTSMETELAKLLPTELSARKFSPLVFAVIGGILGVALTACCAWVAHLGGAKVYSAKALSGCTGIGVLGCIPGEKKNDPVTNWLRKLEGRSVSGGYDAITCDICNRCKDVENLLIAGQYAKPLLAGLTEELNRAGIRCTLCGGMDDPAVFEALPQCDAVLLAETCMQSRYDSVQQMMQTATDYNKAILGCLLIDG